VIKYKQYEYLSSGTTYPNSISTTTHFYVSEISAAGCEGPRTDVLATVNVPDSVRATTNAPICLGSNLNLTATVTTSGNSNNYTYTWLGGANSGISGSTSGGTGSYGGTPAVTTVVPTSTGTYTYTLNAVDATGSLTCYAGASVVVTVNALPVIDSVKQSLTTICAGTPVTLNVYSGSLGQGSQTLPTGYAASNATSTNDDEIFNVTITGTTLNNTSNCTTVAPGAGSIAAEYANYTTSVTPPTLQVGTTYNGSVTIGQCLTTAYSTGYAVFIDLNRNGSFDAGETVYTDASTSSAVAGTVKPFSFTLPTSASSGLTLMRIVAVESTAGTSINPTGTYTWGETEDYAVNIINTIAVNPSLTYTWTPGNISNNTGVTQVTPSTTTTYTVTATSPQGCTSSNSGSYTVNVVPVQVTASANPSTPVCYGTPVALSASATGYAPLTYSWSNGSSVISTAASLNVTPLTTTTYTVTVKDACNNATTSSVTVTVNDNVVASIAETGPIVLCQPASQTLTAQSNAGASSFQWTLNGVAIPGATQSTYTINTVSTGVYAVIATSNTSSCASAPSAGVSVSINMQPTALTITPSDPSICIGAPTTLTVTGGTVPGPSVAFNENFSSNASNWTITNGGSSPNAANWSVRTSPLVYTSPNGGATFTNFSTPNGGKFILAVANAGGNATTTNTVITSPVINTESYTSANLVFEHVYRYFSGDVAKVQVSTDGGTNWSDLKSYTLSQGTTTNGAQVTKRDTISLASYLSQANLKIRFNYVSNYGYYWLIDSVQIAGNAYLPQAITWSPSTGLSSTTARVVSANPSVNTTYTVTATSGAGCTNTATTTVTVKARPTVGINAPATTLLTCSTPSIELTATTDGVGYSWSNGLGTNATATVTAPGTYTVTASAENGCTKDSSITITQNIVAPTAGITNNTVGGSTVLTCVRTAISVTATGGVSYAWDNSLGSSAAASITAPGTYTVTVTGANGCTSTASITVTQDIVAPTAGITNNTVGGSTVLTCVRTAISVTATGGVSYAWDNSLGSSANASITAPGTYTVTVTGANGCTSTASITTTQDIVAPTAGITNNTVGGSTELTCVRTAISVTATGGVSYAWDNSLGSSANASITAPGTYTVTVTGANGCTSTASITTTQDIVAPTAGITNNTVGGSTVLTCVRTAISVTASGGVSYAWDNSLGSSANASITDPGTYTVTVTGANGCTSTASITVTQDIVAPTAGITNNTVGGSTVLTCVRTAISVTATGGVSYAWDNSLGSSANASITAPGTYTVTVTGANGCTSTASITVTQDIVAPTAGITNNTVGGSTVLTCVRTAISVTATGGVSYAWDNSLGSSAAASITDPGTYTVTVTGANGCTSTASITVTQDIVAPTAGITNNTVGGSTELTCVRTAISVTATGGVSYAWDNSLGSSANASITAPGTYTVTVTGANGCTSTASITTTQDIVAPTAGITNNTVGGSTELTCVRTAISVTATGGVSYAWSGGLGSSANASITAPGTYTVTVTGANGCTSTASITVTQDIVAPTAGITNNTVGGSTVLTCVRTAISVTATGGVSYAWDNSLGSAAAASITDPGTYTVTVTGANGCTSTASITVTQDIVAPTAGITNNTVGGSTVLTCVRTAISVTATGGVSYAWDNSLGSSANASITAPGTYTVTVTGANGCTSTASITTTQDIVAPTAGITNNTVGGSTELTCVRTAISVTASGGVSYAWDNSLGSSANASITAPGTYTVTVTGANGCTSTASITTTQDIVAPTAGITNNTVGGSTELTCVRTAISVTATGGVSYAWDNSLGSSANASITAPGTYTVTVTGANGCTSTASITTTQDIVAPTAGITNNTVGGSTVLTCVRTAISVTATGGVSYAWDNSLGSSANASITDPGTYTVTVTGANGCTSTASITVTQDIVAPTAGITNNTVGGSTVLTCVRTAISVTATGGVSYAWDNSLGSSANASITAPGTYTVTVTGANGCTSTASITTTQDIVAPTAGITNNTVGGSTELTCVRTAISVTATGGVSYAWDNSLGSSANASITAPGTYTVTVTGANGCTSTASITTTQDIVAPTAGITNNTVGGSTELTCVRTAISVTASGGVSYAWNNSLGSSANASISAPGTYTVTVTGANGCTSTASITVTQDIVAPTAGITNNTVGGSTVLTCATTSISVTATGGVSYAWDNSLGSSANASITAPGTYTVTVTGANGCTSTASITVTQDIVAPTAGITNNTVGGSTVLTCVRTAISVTATGGVSYAWSGGLGSSANASITAPGTYTVTVTGANGCTSTASITTTQDIVAPTAGITNNTGVTDLTCATPTISVTATGGVSYAWDNSLGSSANASITAPGTYTVTVTGANGCTSTSSITITQSVAPPVSSITNNTGTTVLTCATTSISVTANGGVSYAWNNSLGSASNASITAPGTYTVTVTAANGCTSTASITTTQNVVLPSTPTTSITQPTCSLATGSISVTSPTGSDYTYSIGGSYQSSTLFSGLVPNTYTVTVKRVSTGCISSSATALVNPQPFTPAAPAAIIGESNVCPYINVTPVTYTVAAVPGATNYTWILPTGATIVGGA
jgi:hypothetical protein